MRNINWWVRLYSSESVEVSIIANVFFVFAEFPQRQPSGVRRNDAEQITLTDRYSLWSSVGLPTHGVEQDDIIPGWKECNWWSTCNQHKRHPDGSWIP